MAELTIIIDSDGHKELKEYLMTLKGILEVIIKNEKELEIYIKYDPNLISWKVIRMEIILFLDISKIPSILAFDKHPTIQTSNYKITRNNLCCEYCFKGAIDDLFEIEGIEKVESNFNEENYYQKPYDERDDIIISIEYNPNLIDTSKMEQIEQNLLI